MRWDRRTCEWAHEESKEPPSVTHALNQHCLCQTGSKASFSFSLSPRIGATVSTHIHKLLFTTCRGSCFGSSSEKKAYISSHYTLWMCCNRFALREKKKKKRSLLPPAVCGGLLHPPILKWFSLSLPSLSADLCLSDEIQHSSVCSRG